MADISARPFDGWLQQLKPGPSTSQLPSGGEIGKAAASANSTHGSFLVELELLAKAATSAGTPGASGSSKPVPTDTGSQTSSKDPPPGSDLPTVPPGVSSLRRSDIAADSGKRSSSPDETTAAPANSDPSAASSTAIGQEAQLRPGLIDLQMLFSKAAAATYQAHESTESADSSAGALTA